MSAGDGPVFFATAPELRAWFEQNHATAQELMIGFWKKGSGRGGISYGAAVDQALCFGWIDGVRRSLDQHAYVNRFSPRRPRSNWSAINIARVEQLRAQGLMHPAGLAAFEQRDERRTQQYSFERDNVAFDAELAALLRKNTAAARFFHAQPPGYRKTATHWVTSAKRPETRLRRMQTLIADSERGERIALLRRTQRKQEEA